ncbi:MAG: phospholipase D-like domain-containing protein [Candidatus Sericytochromatia bacterium]
MQKISGLKTFLSTLLIFSAFSCSSENTLNNSELPLQDTRVSSSSLSSFPITVSFNNAYKMLFTDNEPIGRKDPKNPDKYLYSLIDSAKETIDAAFYDIDNPEAADAFIKAKQRGVKVRILTDTDNMKDEADPTKPRKQIADMQNAGIEIKEDKRSGIMHQKFMIVDGKTCLSGSMNLTTTSMYQHNNNVLIFNSPELSTDYTEEFKRMFEENKLGPNNRTISYPEVKVGDATVKIYFSPKGGAMQEVLAELQNAKKSIRFMTFSLTGNTLKDLLISKKTAGLNVEGVMDECLSRGAYSLLRPLKAANIYAIRDGNQALLHHKVFIIDDETVITGSSNYSDSAENSNNENTLVIKSKSIAALYNKEYSRVKYAAQTHKNIPDYDNPACGSQSKVKKSNAF